MTSWDAVDDWIAERLVPADAGLDAALQANAAAGLPAIDVAPNQGKLLHIFARMVNARRILEIGTLGGYSTIWLARAVPEGGKVITLEFSAAHAKVAAANVARAGLASIVEIRTGPALETLPALPVDEPFDLIFLDADKLNYPAYLRWALQLSRPGTVIIADNVVREGGVIEAGHTDPNVQGVQRYIETLAKETRLTSTAVQTVGKKGWDGFAISIVK